MPALTPLELPRLAADESLDSAAIAFLVGVSLEHQKEKEEEEETEELYSQRASLHRRRSGKWSPREVRVGVWTRRCGQGCASPSVILVFECPVEAVSDLLFFRRFGLRPSGRRVPGRSQQLLVVEGSWWRGRRESDSQVFCQRN